MLLIGCANVANLLLARATARRSEMAVRLALGASPGRLVRQSLTEAALLCVIGSAAGLGMGNSLAGVLVSLAPVDIARPGGVGMNPAVLLFCAVACAACVTLIGIAPAMYAARDADRNGIRADLRAATARGAGLRRWVIGGEAALVILLLTVALLFLRTFANLRHVDLGFATEHVLWSRTRPVGHLLQAAPGSRPWPRVQRGSTLSGVQGVLASGLPASSPRFR